MYNVIYHIRYINIQDINQFDRGRVGAGTRTHPDPSMGWDKACPVPGAWSGQPGRVDA